MKVEHKEYIKQLLQDFPNHIITSINLSLEWDEEFSDFYDDYTNLHQWEYMLKITLATKYGNIKINIPVRDSSYNYENNIIATDPLDLLPLLTFKWSDFQQYTIWDYFKYYDLFKQFENYEHFQQIYKYCSEQQAAFNKLLKYDYNYVFNYIFSYLLAL